MNALAPESGRHLVAFDRDEARAPLFRLFSAYPAPWMDKDAGKVERLMDARVAAYKLAVEGIPGWAVSEAVTAFIQGRVEGRKRRDVMPTGEELAVQARAIVEREAARQARENEQRRQVKERLEWEQKQSFLSTDEGRQHMQDRARRAAEIMARAGLAVAMPKEE